MVIFFRARFQSLARSKLWLSSANHRPGYWSNLPCDWPSTAWAYPSKRQKTGPGLTVLSSVNLLCRWRKTSEGHWPLYDEWMVCLDDLNVFALSGHHKIYVWLLGQCSRNNASLVHMMRLEKFWTNDLYTRQKMYKLHKFYLKKPRKQNLSVWS